MKRRRGGAYSRLKKGVIYILLSIILLWGVCIAAFSLLPVPFSAVMLQKQFSAWFSGNFQYVAHSKWVEMDKISPWMPLAVIAVTNGAKLIHPSG